MIRVAIVGLGWAGQRQLEAAGELGRKIAVTCLVDPDGDHLQGVTAPAGTERLTDYSAALADPKIDAVSICTPHNHHAPMAVAAAEAGKHVLVEKPMALTVAEADQMLAAAAANNVQLYVAENASYTPRARFLRTVVTEERLIGPLTAAAVTAGFRAPNFGYPGRRAWLTDPAHGGTGTWMLHGVHTVAELRYILGEVKTVYLCEHKTASFERRDLEGTMSGLLTLHNGLAVSILQSSETKFYGDSGGYTLYGETGILRGGQEGYRLFNGEADYLTAPFVPYPTQPLSSYALELEAFADYISGAAIGPTTGASERQSLAIVQAGYESVASGLPVPVGSLATRD
ncbi:MAG: Gfo/Idh/MocA family oxidoreductase [Caldilineaceae bacterium]|nr:Gfo/Idh/MocA family oxidoreductase [Caldilineaceae bacterium]